MAQVKESYPILLSNFLEMFRRNAVGVSARIAMEDHLLDGKYLIKKGSTMVILAHVQHTARSIWGEIVHQFNHKRFSLPMAAIPVTNWDVGVEVCPRDNKEWRVSASGYDKAIEISAEAIEGVALNQQHRKPWTGFSETSSDLNYFNSSLRGGMGR
ncbi:hypothetical protein DL770_002585 [Monosporascus sp. CRB-9-2]|nr:hypothetical protein DL770_002585 [Monosporascus sp. CRB-9-2]